MTLNLETVYNIPGFLDTEEAYLLHRLASTAQTIVEIGTYYGRATYCMATGAQVSGAHVTTIDAYEPHTIGEMVVTADIPAAVGKMLREQGLSDTVTPIIDDALKLAKTWTQPINVLFIDSSHEYKDVKATFKAWQKHVIGVIAFHDYTDHWPGVQKFVDELVTSGAWEIVGRADATVVIKRVAND